MSCAGFWPPEQDGYASGMPRVWRSQSQEQKEAAHTWKCMSLHEPAFKPPDPE